jgi:hypothetical protein
LPASRRRDVPLSPSGEATAHCQSGTTRCIWRWRISAWSTARVASATSGTAASRWSWRRALPAAVLSRGPVPLPGALAAADRSLALSRQEIFPGLPPERDYPLRGPFLSARPPHGCLSRGSASPKTPRWHRECAGTGRREILRGRETGAGGSRYCRRRSAPNWKLR